MSLRYGLSILLLCVFTLGMQTPAIGASNSGRIASHLTFECQKASGHAAWMQLDSGDAVTAVRADRGSSPGVGAPWDSYDLPAPVTLSPTAAIHARATNASCAMPHPDLVELLI